MSIDGLRDLAEPLRSASTLIRMATPPGDSLGSRLLLVASERLAEVPDLLLAAADRIELEAWGYWWRHHESEWRRVGKYDSADAARQFADWVETSVHQAPTSNLKLEQMNLGDGA